MTPTQVLSGKRLVVVEDDPIVRMGLENILHGAGAIIVRSFSHKADAAVLDLRLGSGVTSVPIAVTLSFRRVPFMFYTAQPETALNPLRNRWPGCKIVSKPSRPEEIIAAVAGILAHPRISPPRLN